jgi:hypothetical protein
MNSTSHSSRHFWIGVAVGWSLIAFGVAGVVVDRDQTSPAAFVRWFVGIGVVHDLVFAPLVLLVSWAVGRVLPRRTVLPVRVGLASTALVVLYSWPVVRGYGRNPANPSVLPLAYGRNLGLTLILVWSAVAVWIASSSWRARGARQGSAGPR